MNKGETKLALQVAQRNYDAQERAMGYLLVCEHYNLVHIPYRADVFDIVNKLPVGINFYLYHHNNYYSL